MTREDRHILLKHGCKLVHNPTSNANNQVGVLETEIIESMGPGLGTDGMQNNMLKEAKEGTLVRAATESPSVDYLELLFQNNPDIAVKIFGKLIGHIEEEAQADLVFYDYDSRTELNADNYGAHLLFGLGKPSDVMTRGRFRLRNQQLVGMDESRIRENARKQSKRLWAAMKVL
jgi:cytosine/adenosine deaminase-related metal-dependent hydrolase